MIWNDITWKAFCSLVDERWLLNECQVALVGNSYNFEEKEGEQIPMEIIYVHWVYTKVFNPSN
jgi:hypothetical protein